VADVRVAVTVDDVFVTVRKKVRVEGPAYTIEI
jgi:hypothetical protein